MSSPNPLGATWAADVWSPAHDVWDHGMARPVARAAPCDRATSDRAGPGRASEERPDEQGHVRHAIALADEATSLDELWHDAASALKAATGARLLVFNDFDERGRLRRCVGDLEALEPWVYFDHFAPHDPMLAAVERDGGSVIDGERFMDWSSIERSHVYNEYYVPHEIGRLLCTRLPVARESTFVALFRARAEAPFSAKDKRALERLRPALQAVARRDRRTRLRRRAEVALSAILELDDGPPRLVVDIGGEVVWASRRARALLGPIEGGRSARLGPLLTAARELVRRRSDEVMALRLGAAGPALRAELHVVRGTAGEVWVMAELDERPAPSLAERYGLTRSELEVLEAIAEGLCNEAIARRRSVSLATVKSHVHRLLGKLGVRSRLQAALLVRDD